MKIGFDAKRYFNNSSGLGNYARWLVDGLAKRGAFEYHLYQPKKISQKVELPLHFPEGLSKLSPSLWRSKFVCTRLVHDGIQIYHGLSNELPYGIHNTNIKAVVTIHDLINKRYPENYGALDRIIYDKKLHYAQKYAATIITPSEQTKKDIIRFYKTDASKIKVIPLSLISKKSQITDPIIKGKYILCVSGFSKRKNIPRLLEAFNSITDNTIKLVLAGHRGDALSEVQSLAANNPNIIIKLGVSDQELSNLYLNSLFCVYPSVFEGFGIPILEAFSYGKTVATSNISSMPEVGGNAAHYFNPTDVNDITIALNSLTDEQIRSGLEQKIERRLQSFESPKLLSAYEKIYEEIL